ncbi:TPA: hypothetical protein ENS27_00130 [bacterium]|nr:hypothetical protein [bacterium]
MANKLIKTVFILIFLFLPLFSALSWEVIKTDYFTVFYEKGYEKQAREFLNALEYYRPKAEKIVGNGAMGVPIVVEDIGTIANGMTDPINNRIFLYTYKPSAKSLGTSLESWETDVGIHEYIHLLHMRKANGFMGALSSIFGNYFIPNIYSFGWIVEGITVYTESQITPYQGRLNDGYYDSYVATRVKDGRFPSILEAHYSPIDYPYYDGIYNYGGVFFEHLSKTYGEDKFARFFDNYGSSLPIFMINYSAKQVYGKSFSELWKEWKKYESERSKDFVMEGERLTNKGWYTSDLVLYNDKLYYIRTYIEKTGAFDSYVLSAIIQRDIRTGKEETLITTTSSFLTPFKIHNGKIYYTLAEVKSGYANVSYMKYGFYSILCERDIETGKDKVLLKDEIRDFDVMPDGNVIYSRDKKDKFGSEIIKYDVNTKEKNTLFDSDYIVDRMVINNNRVIVSARKDWANYSLYMLNLDNGDFIPIADNPRFEGFHSVYGDKIFWTANYGEVYSTYCYDMSSGRIYRITKNGYSSYPVYNEANNKLYHIGLNSYGYDIYAKDIEWHEGEIPFESATIPPNNKIDDSIIRKGSYLDNLKTLFPSLRLPNFYYDEGSEENAFGLLISGQDTLRHFPYSAELLYDFSQKKPLYNISFSANVLMPLSTSFTARNIDKEQEYGFDMKYPLLLRMKGLTDLYVGLSAKTYNESKNENINRTEFSPYVSSAFTFPKTSINLGFKTFIERENIRSTIDRNAFAVNLGIDRYIKKSALHIRTKGIYDPDSTYDPKVDNKSDSLFPVIRGYDDPIDAKIGMTISADLTASIFPLRFGFFIIPYIFFEDVCGSLFFDASIPKDIKNPQMSTGLELHIETHALMYLPFDFGMRFVVNRYKDLNIEPFAKLGFSF